MLTAERATELIARKHAAGRTIGECVVAIESVPRLGFTGHHACTLQAMHELGMGTELGQGVFWGQVLTRTIEKHLVDGTRYILTLDYDTIFSAEDVRMLFATMEARPDIDAVCAVQVGRENGRALFCVTSEDGTVGRLIEAEDLRNPLLRIKTGHFGLTMFRASAFSHLEKPWFLGVPSADGGWNDGRLDEDIAFWGKWWDAGNTLYQCNHAVIGHMESVITWPDQQLQPIRQGCNEHASYGRPTNSLNYSVHRTVGTNEEIRLNVGSGTLHIEGYHDVDLVYGERAYPLDWPDESVVEVRASHILEHFPRWQAQDVVRDWVRVLRPGGVLKIAVPDFDDICQLAKSGTDKTWEAYLMGGHTGTNDVHHSVWTRGLLESAMRSAGLTRIWEWKSGLGDCADLPISLNLQGVKP